MIRFSPSLLLLSCSLGFLFPGCASADPPPDMEKRRIITTTNYRIVNEKTEPPVLKFHWSNGHHGQRISESDISRVLVWKDGTIVWSIAKDSGFWNLDADWYQSTIPVEKVEKAVTEIVESFEKYPIKDRPLETRMVFRIGAHSSPTITVLAPELYEFFWMDNFLFEYYTENRADFQAGDPDTMLKALINLDDTFIDFKGLVYYYREELPWAGLNSFPKRRIGDEVLRKCAALFTADGEHLTLMEKRILELVPPHEGLEPKEFEYESQDVKVEQEIVDGKRRFFYSLITEEEDDAIWEELRKQQ